MRERLAPAARCSDAQVRWRPSLAALRSATWPASAKRREMLRQHRIADPGDARRRANSALVHLRQHRRDLQPRRGVEDGVEPGESSSRRRPARARKMRCQITLAAKRDDERQRRQSARGVQSRCRQSAAAAAEETDRPVIASMRQADDQRRAAAVAVDEHARPAPVRDARSARCRSRISAHGAEAAAAAAAPGVATSAAITSSEHGVTPRRAIGEPRPARRSACSLGIECDAGLLHAVS